MKCSKRKLIPVWFCLGLLVIAAIWFVLQTQGNKVLPPDYTALADDPNARTQEQEDEPEDRVTLRLPKGDISLDIKTDLGFMPKESGRIKIILPKDETEHIIFEDEISVTEEGTLPDLQLDFTKVHVELKPGRYIGWVVFTALDGEETKIRVLILIYSTKSGSMTVEYSDKVTVNLKTGEIRMRYIHGADATHDCVLQLILDNSGKEYLLAQSGALHAGQSLQAMTLEEGMSEKLSAGVYHGRLRLNLYNSENELHNMNTDIEVSITVE